MPDPRRIAVVYRLDHPGGVQSVALALMRGLNQRGIIPEVLWDLPPDAGLLERSGVQASYHPLKYVVPTKRIDKMATTLRYLSWVINGYNGSNLAGQYDFFYVFDNGFFLPSSVPHLRYLSGPPLLPQLVFYQAGVRGWPGRGSNWLYRSLLKYWKPVYEYHRGSKYVINSQYTADLFEQAHGVRLPVVYPPISFAGRGYRAGDLAQRDSLTFFSRVVAYKRPEMVIELAARHPELRCVVMGAVPDHRRAYFESLVGKAESLGVRNAVFLANPDPVRVQAELARCRFYVFPGVNEHFGMTTVEAVASGAIPFVHNSGGQREIVFDDSLRFKNSDFYEGFDALAALPVEQLEALRDRMAEHIQQFSEEVSVGQLLSYLDPNGNGTPGSADEDDN